MPFQLQILAVIIAIVFFTSTVHLTRKGHAEVRQMNKWLFLGIIMILGALFPPIGNTVAKFLGITTLTSLALFLLTGILLFFSLVTQITLINTEKQLRVLTQELSLLKKKMNETEED
ncbi:DUF2304 family protein [Enterococcus quebecensis]|uniref:DUF2304 domain-containing protein n=1 Tax=Enterococcus quebecensis TaxID=903983 RepID=A0A1E5GWW9_9ENTE|nr:DUF2304 domain-containing protein [Enterococcus quebecensis]OEG17172.1 hypothetical protein BCR23_03985 [Enterococcus quebecensis]OJG75562.1 hypothetical protein RV12_GL001365 [Enterococcus quebecensis]